MKHKMRLLALFMALFMSIESVTVQAADRFDLYAQWEAQSVTLVFDSNGHGSPPDSVVYTYGKGDTFPGKSSMSSAGYSFTGWNTEADGSGEACAEAASADEFIIKHDDETITLYAQWTLINYSITYDLGGGSASGNKLSYTVEDPAFTLVNPTRNAYEFSGWTGSNGSSAQMSVTVPHGSTGNKNYTANWKEKRIQATPVAVEGIANGTTYRPQLTTDPSGCTIEWGSSAGNYNYGTSTPGASTKGRYVYYFRATKSGWLEATGQCVVTVRNPTLTSSATVTENTDGSFNILGNGGSIQTSCQGRYFTYYSINNGATQKLSTNGRESIGSGLYLTRTTTATNEYGFVRTTYKIENTSSTSQSIRVAVGVDTMLAGNDAVPLRITDKGVQADTSSCSFMYYFRNTDGVDYATTVHIGTWSPCYNGTTAFTNDAVGTTFSGDSGLNASWSRTVPAYSTVEVSWGCDML